MNAARVLVVVAVASTVVYLLMRYPGMRRPRFQDGPFWPACKPQVVKAR